MTPFPSKRNEFFPITLAAPVFLHHLMKTNSQPGDKALRKQIEIIADSKRPEG